MDRYTARWAKGFAAVQKVAFNYTSPEVVGGAGGALLGGLAGGMTDTEDERGRPKGIAHRLVRILAGAAVGGGLGALGGHAYASSAYGPRPGTVNQMDTASVDPRIGNPEMRDEMLAKSNDLRATGGSPLKQNAFTGRNRTLGESEENGNYQEHATHPAWTPSPWHPPDTTNAPDRSNAFVPLL